MIMYSVSRFTRRLCATLASTPMAISCEASASASVPKAAKKQHSVYEKLLSLGKTGQKMEETLNQLIMASIPVEKHDLIRYADVLCEFSQPQHALEIFEWMERKKIDFSRSDQTIRLDLIAETNDFKAAEHYFNSLEDSTVKN